MYVYWMYGQYFVAGGGGLLWWIVQLLAVLVQFQCGEHRNEGSFGLVGRCSGERECQEDLMAPEHSPEGSHV